MYFGAVVVVMAIMPIVTRAARALQIVDDPGVRKIHKSKVPRIGGLAVLIGMLTVTVPALALDNAIGAALRETLGQVVVLLAASIFMFVVGLADDVKPLRARVKLAAQLLAAGTVCAFGMRVESVTVGSLTVTLGWLSWPATVIWIVGITNAVNLIDGLDGLAAGICAVTCGVIAVFCFYTGQIVMAVLMLALLGSLTGFLFFNFNPAKVFLGDCGTLFVGFFLASSSVMCAAKSLTIVGLALPALALGLPIFDTLLSILRRVLERRSIFSPDRNHIHHRLLTMGLHQRGAVIVMYVVTLCAACLGMSMMIMNDLSAIVVFLIVSLLLLGVFRFTGAIRLGESVAILKRNLSLARRTREEKRDFESLQLRMREVNSFQDWWSALCDAAEKMGFLWLGLAMRNGHETIYRYRWRRPGAAPQPGKAVSMSLPVPQEGQGVSLWLDATVGVNGSLEGVGRRMTLFERLIDEHSMPGPLALRVGWQPVGPMRPAALRPPRSRSHPGRRPAVAIVAQSPDGKRSAVPLGSQSKVTIKRRVV